MTSHVARLLGQGIIKREVSLYRWPPVWLVWISLLQIKTQIVSFHTADSKPVKQEVNSSDTSPFCIPWLGKNDGIWRQGNNTGMLLDRKC